MKGELDVEMNDTSAPNFGASDSHPESRLAAASGSAGLAWTADVRPDAGPALAVAVDPHPEPRTATAPVAARVAGSTDVRDLAGVADAIAVDSDTEPGTTATTGSPRIAWIAGLPVGLGGCCADL